MHKIGKKDNSSKRKKIESSFVKLKKNLLNKNKKKKDIVKSKKKGELNT